MRVFCGTCKRETNHDVLEERKEKFSNEEFWGDDIWQIIRCKGCDETSFRHNWFFSEDYERQEKLYPERGEDKLSVKSFISLRKNRVVKRIYREVISSFNKENYTLCAVGIRAIIEGICKYEGIKSGLVKKQKPDGTFFEQRTRNLEGRISGLKEKDFITQKYADSLHDLRFIGNEAVHELEEPSREELEHAIKIIEHLIENIYEIRRTAEELKKMRAEAAILKKKP